MKSFTVKLPERVFQELRHQAEASGISLEDFSTDILVNYAFSSTETAQAARAADGAGLDRKETLQQDEPRLEGGARRGGSWQAGEPSRKQEKSFFSVAREFQGMDRVTIQQTQKFVDTALDYRGVTAFKNDGGIGFEPNFVFIERVYTKEVGFAASFYGSPSTFDDDYRISMLPGRGYSYSRLKVKSEEDLEVALKALHISAHLKSLERI